MINQGALEAWISGAGKGGWEWFNAQPGLSEDQVKALQAKMEARKERLAAAWRGFAETPEGQEALQALVDVTLNRAVPPSVSMGLTMEQTAMYAQFREGQNNVAHMILKLIAHGRGDADQPPKREMDQ